jgi:short-chain Z-isoprenyl diphosphate synthase
MATAGPTPVHEPPAEPRPGPPVGAGEDRGTVSVPAAPGRSQDHRVTAWRWWNRWLYWLYERRLLAQVRGGAVPQHLGIIMDGNRRFARAMGLDPKAGHDYGAGKARDVLRWCLDLGIRHVTLWGFSTDNKGRSPEEVAHLHRIFAAQAREFLSDRELHAHRVRVRVIGDIEDFPEDAQAALREMEAGTAGYDALHLHVALGYGGREEIVSAVRAALHERAARGEDLATAAAELDAADITAHLYTAGVPDPTSSSGPRARCARRASCCGSPPTPSSTSATPTGPSSGASTSCAPSARSSSANGASGARTRGVAASGVDAPGNEARQPSSPPPAAGSSGGRHSSSHAAAAVSTQASGQSRRRWRTTISLR